MKNLSRPLILLAALALVSAASGRALGHYPPGSCVYQCENEAGQTVNGNAGPLDPDSCCAGNYPHTCPSGYSWAGTLFYVDSFGPELCGF
jgi:hypothetical protein